MQPVNRQTKAPWQPKRLWLIMVMIAALGLTVFLLLRQPEKVEIGTPNSKILPTVVFESKDAKATSITLSPAGHKPYTFQNANDVFILDGQPDFDVDQAKISQLLDALMPLEAEGIWASGRGDETYHAHDYGIDDKAPSITLSLSDGRELTLILGQQAPTDPPQYYANIAKNPRLLTVAADVAEWFHMDLNAFHLVPDLGIDIGALKSITLNRDGAAITLTKQVDSWMITTPWPYPADNSEMSAMIAQVEHMSLAVFEDKVTDNALSEYGLSDPWLKCTLVFSVEGEAGLSTRDVSLSLGKSVDKLGWYALYEGNIYRLSSASLGMLATADARSLTTSHPLSWPFDQIVALKIAHGDETSSFTLRHDAETSARADSEQALSLLVTNAQGEQVDASTFVTRFVAMARLVATTERTKISSMNGKPAWEVDVTLADGRVQPIRISDYDSLRYVIEVDGVRIQTMNRSEVDQTLSTWLQP